MLGTAVLINPSTNTELRPPMKKLREFTERILDLGEALILADRAVQCVTKMAEFEGCTPEDLMDRIENDPPD